MCLRSTEDGDILLSVRVTPNASKNAILDSKQDTLGVKLTTPPVEGRANKALLKFLAKKLRVPASSMTIIRGRSSRTKLIRISDQTLEYIRSKL